MTKLHNAIIFATLKHQNQKRKGTNIPYIVHPMEVMQILTSMQLSENIIIAGILHDTLEDTDTTPEEIKKLFGDDILKIVQTESEDKTKSWKERKQTTIDELKNASFETAIVCFADKFSNVKSMYCDKLEIGSKLWERFNAPKESIEWYYREIAGALKNIEIPKNQNVEKINSCYEDFIQIIDLVFCE